MRAILDGRRVMPVVSCALLVLANVACGGGGDGADRAVVLAVQASDPPEKILLEAAREHGAPGENESVLYRIKGSESGAMQAAARALRAHGFSDVEVE